MTGSDTSQAIGERRAAWNEPGLYRHLAGLEKIRRRRRVRYRSPPVVSVESTESADQHRWYPEGTIVIFSAHRDSDLASEFLDAAVSDNPRPMEGIRETLTSQSGSQEAVGLDKAVEVAEAAPALFDVRYGGKELARDLFVPTQHEADVAVLPFAGGELASDQFEIIEHIAEDADPEPYEYVIVQSPPRLNEIEAAALETVPTDRVESKVAELPITAVVKLAVCMPVVVMASNSSFSDRISAVSLSKRDVREHGSAAAPRELLARRREIFEEYGLL